MKRTYIHNGYTLKNGETFKDVSLETNKYTVEVPFEFISEEDQKITYYRKMEPGTVLVRKEDNVL